jgi:hypothetical protein
MVKLDNAPILGVLKLIIILQGAVFTCLGSCELPLGAAFTCSGSCELPWELCLRAVGAVILPRLASV